MARIRKIEIKHFRSIQSLVWYPAEGLNCLIGPGDSGKSTVLDAIDLCLGARRTIQFTDTDFYGLDVDTPIEITLTIGMLDDTLKNFETYGLYLRGYNSANQTVEDEPEVGLEPVLCLNLTVNADLEPVWSLISDRALGQNVSRNLAWTDRARLAPTRIGALSDYNLGWRRGSVLNRLADEKADASAALVKAARDARASFGDEAETQLGQTLQIVGTTACDLGIPVGARVRALLDAHSVTFGGGTISLHNAEGIPLRSLGTGSTRLLIAGLQRQAAEQSAILLVDELEHGLEPHRLVRFIGSLGAKEDPPPIQAFVTSHSPVALRELSAAQLVVLRKAEAHHDVLPVNGEFDLQGTLRLYAEAFLATSVLVCEGASEVGLMRGIDQYRTKNGNNSLFASGTTLVDAYGEKNLLKIAEAFHALQYRVAILRDDDVPPNADGELEFTKNGGKVFLWQPTRKLEVELFYSLPAAAILALLDKALSVKDEAVIDSQLQSASNNAVNLALVRAELARDDLSEVARIALGKASSGKNAPWFKSVTAMEEIGREIVGPFFAQADDKFKKIVSRLFDWVTDAEPST